MCDKVSLERKSQVVNNDGEFYLAVAVLKKPIILKPINPGDWKELILSEIQCSALLNFTEALGPCQCSTDKFPPDYPFIVAETDA